MPPASMRHMRRVDRSDRESLICPASVAFNYSAAKDIARRDRKYLSN
jgi:hypothetical protein